MDVQTVHVSKNTVCIYKCSIQKSTVYTLVHVT